MATAAERIKEFAQEMNTEQTRAWLLKLVGPPFRELLGDEKEQMITLLSLIEPYEASNNQRSWTDVYIHAGRQYELTTFEDGSTALCEYLEKKYDI